jgi:hypothetical protein
MDSASRAGAATVGANSPVAMLPSSTQRLLYVGQLPANRLVGIPATDPKRSIDLVHQLDAKLSLNE